MDYTLDSLLHISTNIIRMENEDSRNEFIHLCINPAIENVE